MTDVLCNHCVVAGRRGKARFAGRDSRFPDKSFALVKVRFLFADMNDDLCRARRVLIMPPTHLSGAWKGTLRQSLATANDQGDQACTCDTEETARVHEGAYLSAFS